MGRRVAVCDSGVRWIVSALVGAGSHVAIDSFTHRENWGSRSLGLDRLLFTAPNGDFTIARVVQYLGHSVGSMVGVYLLWTLARSRTPPSIVERPTPVAWTAAGAVALGGAVAAVLWMQTTTAGDIFVAGFGLAITLLATSVVVESIARLRYR